jgi:hypothetical protein
MFILSVTSKYFLKKYILSLLIPFTNHAYSVSIVWVDYYNTLCNINIVEDNTSVPIASNVEANRGQYLWTVCILIIKI